MNASNTIILNADNDFNAEIVLSSELSINTVTALVQQNGELVLMRAYPMVDPSDRLLPESVIEAAVDYAKANRIPFKVWAVGEMHMKNGEVMLGKTVVGKVTGESIELFDIQTMIKRCFH